MKKSPKPNQSYFELVFYTDPTYGHTYPVFLLNTDAKNAYFTSVPVFLALKNADALSLIKNKVFVSPYKPDAFESLSEIDREKVFFADTMDLNWFYYEECTYQFSDDRVIVSYLNSGFKTSLRNFHYDIPPVLKENQIIEHLSLLHIFCSYFFQNEPLVWQKENRFISDLANHHIDLIEFFKKDVLYFLHLYALHFAEPNELDNLLFKNIFSSNPNLQRVSHMLSHYRNEYE